MVTVKIHIQIVELFHLRKNVRYLTEAMQTGYTICVILLILEQYLFRLNRICRKYVIQYPIRKHSTKHFMLI